MQGGFWNLECTLRGKPAREAAPGEQLEGSAGQMTISALPINQSRAATQDARVHRMKS